MLFNTSTKYDFQPELKVDGEGLEVVSQMKLLGVIVSDDLRWHENTLFITKKAYSIIWMLRRLNQIEANNQILLDTYYKQIKSVLELACIVWISGLTQEIIHEIERVQKSVLGVILGSNYSTYKEACFELNVKTLIKRRKELSVQFAKRQAHIQCTNHGLWTILKKIRRKLKSQHTNQPALINSASQPYLTWQACLMKLNDTLFDVTCG